MTSQEAFRRLNDVRDEFEAAKFAASRTLRGLAVDPDVQIAAGTEQITLNDMEMCAQNLSLTYLTRMFAEFEGILRDYWRYGRGRVTKPPMFDLMNSVAAYCTMSSDDVDDAHEVRVYRNDVIHEREEDPRFDFHTCRQRIARFVRWLPQQW